MVCDIDNG